MRKIILCLLLLLQMSFVCAQKSDIVITGKAVDDTGMSFIGVTIREKGTTLGTVTDAQGDFSLSLPAGERTITISFIGYRTAEIKVNGSEYWDIVFYDSSFDVERKLNNSPSKVPVLSNKLRSETDGLGVFYMKDDMPANRNLVPAMRIKSIKPSGNGFKMKEAEGKNYLTGIKIDYTSFVKVSSVGRLPETAYDQGNDFFRNGSSFGNTLNVKTPIR